MQNVNTIIVSIISEVQSVFINNEQLLSRCMALQFVSLNV